MVHVDKQSLGIRGCAALLFVGLSGVYTAPFQLTLFAQELEFSLAQSGLLVSAHIIAVAGAALSAAVLTRKLVWRSIIAFGIMAFVVGQGGSILAQGFVPLLVARVLAGIGAGFFYAAANALISAKEEPERAYGLAYALMSLGFVVLLGFLPSPLNFAQPVGLFGTSGLLGIALASLVMRIPDRLNEAGGAASNLRAKGFLPFVLLLAITFYCLACGGSYALSENVARRVGLEPSYYTTILGIFAVTGVAGSLAVGWVGLKLGRGAPLFLGAVLTGTSLLAFLNATGGAAFAAGLLGYGFLYMFTVSYILGAAAALDPNGRIAVIASGYLLLPYALGPALFGALAEHVPPTALGWVAAAFCGIAAALLVTLSLTLKVGDHHKPQDRTA